MSIYVAWEKKGIFSVTQKWNNMVWSSISICDSRASMGSFSDRICGGANQKHPQLVGNDFFGGAIIRDHYIIKFLEGLNTANLW